MPSWFQRFTIGAMVLVLTLASIAGVFGFAKPAHAQIPVGIVTSIPAVTQTTLDQIWQGLKSALLNAASRIISYAMRKIAYDGAVWLASGGKGQTPFAHTKSFGDYLGNVADNALGQGIEALGSKFGMNLCKLPDIQTDLALRIGLRTGFQTPGIGGVGGGTVQDPTQKPACSFSEFTKNWSDGNAWKSKFDTAQQSMTEQLNSSLNFTQGGGGGLQTILDTKDKVNQLVQSQTAAAQLSRTEGQGYAAKTSLISNQIQTPSGIIKKEFETNTPGDLQAKDEAQIQALLTTGDIKVIPNVLSAFLNTLVSTMVKNYQDKGILPFGLGCKTGSEGCLAGETANTFEGAGFVSNRAAAQDLFSSFLTVKIGAEDSYDILSELGNCEGKGTYNCRADQGLIQAARQTEGGQSITIAEALKAEGGSLLHGEWKLIPYLNREADNAQGQQVCTRAYCESNIKVLRQIRLLPLGFEIAAHNSDPDRPWTLSQVVDGFNDCLYKTTLDKDGNTVKTVIPDPVKHPFCHLIDPNWVLKVPESRCNAKVNSAVQLSKDAPTRLEDCVDLSSCVAYNADGSCANYAYCTREQNSWDFGPATKCEAQWRSCQTYTNTDTNVSVNYLQRTLDTGSCAAADVGCRAYSLNQGVVAGQMQWLQPSGITSQNNFSQQAIFFNNKLPQTCSANSAGCTAFQVASSTVAGPDLRYLRKAPDYLGCYDSNSSRADGVQWPQTTTDLNSLSQDTACSAYAGACTAQEVGCAMYTNKNSGDQVPGKISQQNVCAPECVGYNAYQEMASNYSNGQSVAYAVIQPNQGPQCTKQDVGCSSFTNLSTTNGGQENVEYYSYLRPCNLPNEAPTKTFTTFEGSTQGGFQLKTYTLTADATGAPAQWTKVPSDATAYVSGPQGCNETNYKAKKATPECRQFNDEAGKVYYALLDKTIPVAKECTPYRLNSTEFNPQPAPGQPGGMNAQQCSDAKGNWDGTVCQLCFQNGAFDAKSGSCTYFGLPSGVQNNAYGSNSCTADVESCREYRGNEGFNVKVYPVDTFEVTSTQAIWAWGGSNIKLSPESTHAGEQSLSVVGTGLVAIRTVSTTVGEGYLVTFWAKGSVNTLSVGITDKNNTNLIQVGSGTIGDTWRQYSFGPVQYTMADENAAVTFSLSQNGSLFIDNFSIQQVNGVEYRVKNKLTVPTSCDADPNDNLPGSALGCSLYTSSQLAQPVPLTGFDFLCREKAIGCSAFIDTHNTLTNAAQQGDDGTQSHLYKVFLPGNGTAAQWDLYYGGYSIANCRTGQGDKGCTVDLFNMDPADVLANATVNNKAGVHPLFTTSTVYVAGDATTTPIYLVNNPSLPGQCSATDLGCVNAGVETQTPSGFVYTTSTIKNDPALYSSTLCKQESVGCSAWSDTSGGTSFFRDPKVVGQKLCEYKVDQPTESGSKISGWMWQGVGKCYDTVNPGKLCSASSDCGSPKTCSNSATPSACTTDADCTGANSTCVDSCRDVGAVACYNNYTDNNGKFGLWSYGDTNKYDNFVGVCPADKNGCSEFVDHNNVDSNGSSHADYFIKDEKINAGDCNGLVSQKAGCILFDLTSNPSKYWDTAATYNASTAGDGVPVKPVVSQSNDANILLKVQPNRQCGEWIQCRQSYTVWDPSSGKPKSVCQDIGRCDKADPANPSECSEWVDGAYELAGTSLDEGTYVSRPATWSTKDFSGYSILNEYPVEELDQVNISADPNNPDWRLVKSVRCGGGANCADKTATSDSTSCDASVAKNGSATCGLNSEGLCYNGHCVRSAKAVSVKDTPIKLDQQKQLCRAYPETDSPFPNSTAMDKLSGGGSQLFATVKVCNENQKPQSGENANLCECDYTKVKYGDSIIKYWNYAKPAYYEKMNDAAASTYNPKARPATTFVKVSSTSTPPNGICLGGNKDGAVCSSDNDCYSLDSSDPKAVAIPTGSCQKQQAQNKYLGWKGFCLEYDMSRSINGDQNQHPCLTWYPIDTLTGAADISSQHVEAGYIAPPGQYYCAASNGGSWWDKNDPNGWLTQVFADDPALRAKYALSTANPLVAESYPANFVNAAATSLGGLAVSLTCGGDPTFISCAAAVGSLEATAQALNKPESDIAYQNTPLDTYGGPYIIRNLGALEGQMSRARYTVSQVPLDHTFSPIKMQDIERINLNVQNGDDEDPIQNTQFEIYPNNFQAQGGTPQNIYKDIKNRKGDTNGRAATGRYLGRPYEFVLFYSGKGDRDYISEDGTQVCYGDNNTCNALHGNLFSAGGLDKPAVGTEGIWNDKSLTRNKDLCPTGGGNGNWNAIRFHFNPNTPEHELQWYDTAYCDDSANIGSIEYKITFQMKEWCQVLADTQSPTPSLANQTAAWTDRLWMDKNKAAQFKFGDTINGAPPAYKIKYTIDTDAPQFGKISLNEAASYSTPQVQLTPAGQPTCYTQGSCINNLDNVITYYGAPYSCLQGQCARSTPSPGGTPTVAGATKEEARQYLGSLFAHLNGLSVFDTTLQQPIKYGGYVLRADPNDYTATGDPTSGIKPKAPRVNPIVPGSCKGDGLQSGQCVEDQSSANGGITINDKSNGEVKVFNGAAKVYMKFYMNADDNQMPLRSVNVDWKNDGKPTDPRQGYFYNERGLVPEKCTPPTGALRFQYDSGLCSKTIGGVTTSIDPVKTCTKDSDCGAPVEQCTDPGNASSFGYIKSPDSQNHVTCQSNYYQAYTVYDCYKDGPGWQPNGCGSNSQAQFPNGCCIYKPKVQVKDNWNWCNGTCDATSKGCYDATPNGKCADPKAWTQFAGTVIVAPTIVK